MSLTMYGGIDMALIVEHGGEFDNLLDDVNPKVPMGDFAYDYSHCYKLVDPVAYGLSFYDWYCCKMEDLADSGVSWEIMGR
jgi:hypothetical protein